MRLSRLFLLICSVATVVASRPAAAQDATTLAPRDTAVFVHIERLREHRKAIEDEPMVKFILKQSELDQMIALRTIETTLRMPLTDVLDIYFGTEVVMVAERLSPLIVVPVKTDADGQNPAEVRRMSNEEYWEYMRSLPPEERRELRSKTTRERPSGVIFSRVAPDDMKLLHERLDLRPAEKAGEFATYNLFVRQEDEVEPSHLGIVAYNNEWIALAAPEHDIYLRKILNNIGRGESLDHDDDFLDYTFELPPNRLATVFVRERKDIHAIAAMRTNRSTVMHYSGTSEFSLRMFERLGDAQALDFGPLPRQAVAAYSANFHVVDFMGPAGRNMSGFLDQFFAPKTMAKDILPAIGAPTVFFAGEIPQDQLDPNPGFPIPAFGIAFKLKNPEVAADINQAMQGVLTMANMAAMTAQLQPIEIRKVNHAGAILHTANLGPLWAVQTRKPEMEHMFNLSYGQIGDWYFFCTHDMLLKHSAVARSGDFGPSNKMRPQPDAVPFARIYVRPEGLSTLFKNISENPALKNAFNVNVDGEEFLKEFSEVWFGYESLDVNFSRRDDNMVLGRAELIRKEEEQAGQPAQ